MRMMMLERQRSVWMMQKSLSQHFIGRQLRIFLDMDADDYPQEEGVDSDSDSTFVPEGLDGDDEIDMNIAQ